MDIVNLKHAIIKKEIPPYFMIFQYDDDPYLAKSYVSAISKATDRKIVYVDDLNEVVNIRKKDALGLDKSLYVMEVSKEEEINTHECEILDFTIVMLNSTKELENVMFKTYSIKFPKLTNETLVSLIKSKCPGLSEIMIKYLMEILGNNPTRLENELRKISPFDKEQQSLIFRKLAEEGNYSSLSNTSTYDFCNNLISRNLSRVIEDYREVKDTNAIGVCSLLIAQLRPIVLLQTGGVDPRMEISNGSLYHARSKVNLYQTNKLVNIYVKLNEILPRVKKGEISQDLVFDYILSLF